MSNIQDPWRAPSNVLAAGDVENMARDYRAALIRRWAIAAFGELEATDLRQRGVRLLEEAIEAFQAAGGDTAMAHQLVDFVFGRPKGELGQELGGLAVCLHAIAAAAGLSADVEECREIARVLNKPRAEFTARNAAKNAAGFRAARCDGQHAAPPCGTRCWHHATPRGLDDE